MKIFWQLPETRVDVQFRPRAQPIDGPVQINVTMAPGPSPAAGLAQVGGIDVVTLVIGRKGQPRGLPSVVAGNVQPTQPSPLFIEDAVVTPVVQHLRQSLENESPWRSAFAQLSWMPRTNFGNKAGLHAFAHITLGAVDWLIFSAGLLIGIAALPTLFPIVRCVKAFNAVGGMQNGIADLQFANQLLHQARDLPEITTATAQDILQIYRGQACRPRIRSVEHRSGWSSLAERELLRYLDTRVPGFSLQVRGQDVRDKRNAMFFKAGSLALVMATQSASKAGISGNVTTKAHDGGLDWSKLGWAALCASTYA